MLTSDLEYAKWSPLDSLDETQAKEELLTLREAWEWVPSEVKFWVVRVGQDSRLVLRNYKGYRGQLRGAEFKLEYIESLVMTTGYDHEQGKEVTETKTIKVPWSQVAHIEFLHEIQDVSTQVSEDLASVSDNFIKSMIGGTENGEDTADN